MTVYDVDIEMTVFEYMLHKYIQKKYIKALMTSFLDFTSTCMRIQSISIFLRREVIRTIVFLCPQPALSCLSLSCCLGGDGETTGKECWLGNARGRDG